MTILFLHDIHSTGGGVIPTYLKDHGHTVINPQLPDEDFDAALTIAQAEFDKHKPDVIVGSSRGGALAMNLKAGETPLLLLCPAWKKYGAAKAIRANSTILHSRADDVIPFADSEKLVTNSDLPAYTLVETGSDHRLADLGSLEMMELVARSFMVPASFCRDYPYAYHVLPLHALKLIASSRRLLSKADLRADTINLRRSSTADVDYALGLSKFIHFYLPNARHFCFSNLPILNAQLKESTVPPFPHVVISIPTSSLSDSQSNICNFNAAVSRPSYSTVKGGNHSRGTAPETILRHWQGFRNDSPNAKRLRHSFWHDGIAVPLMMSHQITLNPLRVGYNTKAAELLIRSPFEIPKTAKLFVFSDADHDSVQLLKQGLEFQVCCNREFEWYFDRDHVPPPVRIIIDKYFCDPEGELPVMNYDMVRSVKKRDR